MRVTVTTLTCDRCGAEVTHTGDTDPTGWATPTLVMGGV